MCLFIKMIVTPISISSEMLIATTSDWLQITRIFVPLTSASDRSAKRVVIVGDGWTDRQRLVTRQGKDSTDGATAIHATQANHTCAHTFIIWNRQIGFIGLT